MFEDGISYLPNHLCSYNYQRLQKVTFPDGLSRIGNWAYYGCKSLLEINKIPRTVDFIGENAFRECTLLKAIEFEDHDGTSRHKLIIGHAAFQRCMALERVTLPSSVNHVGEFAFSTCYVLTEVNLSVTRIRYRDFHLGIQ